MKRYFVQALENNVLETDVMANSMEEAIKIAIERRQWDVLDNGIQISHVEMMEED
jgi:hypothetical protein